MNQMRVGILFGVLEVIPYAFIKVAILKVVANAIIFVSTSLLVF
jgi:hypothetical protein